jgi:hypothetical protein
MTILEYVHVAPLVRKREQAKEMCDCVYPICMYKKKQTRGSVYFLLD